MRRDLHQQETLAEIFGTQDAALGEPRTRLEVVVPYARAMTNAVFTSTPA